MLNLTFSQALALLSVVIQPLCGWCPSSVVMMLTFVWVSLSFSKLPAFVSFTILVFNLCCTGGKAGAQHGV